MRQVLDELTLKRRLPVLGVCVGMQIMANSSGEGQMHGLGWIDGVVKKLEPLKLIYTTFLPHMGWNNIQPIKETCLFKNIDSDSRFYFLHSYYFQCKKENMLATTDYGGEFTSAVNSGNIFGVQFHPEKSHQWGIRLLENFARL